MITLNNWSTTTINNDPYLAPELRKIHLQGKVTGHPCFPDGHQITTTRIIDADGLVVKTKNTTYHLGTIDPGFEAWLAEHRPDFDPENPITIIK